MKRLLFLFLSLPELIPAQKPLPRFEKDTLYTNSGFIIYKGQTLFFGKGTGKNGNFKFMHLKYNGTNFKFTDNSVIVKKLQNFGISSFGNAYIEILGSVLFKDGTKGHVDFHIAFDSAIVGSKTNPGELIVPEEFRKARLIPMSADTSKLYFLFINNILTKDQYDQQIKKMLRN